MAGAGYKLFNTGDVLTAAQVNTYLNEQTVMVFASSTARTTALSGVLAEGMMSYLQDTNSVEVYNGSSWVALASGDVTEVQAGTGISVASGTGPIPVVTNTMATAINAAGDLIYGTANDTFSRLGIGTAGQVLKVNSGATAPEWGAASSGALTLVSATTFSAVASHSVDSVFTSTYKYYRALLVFTASGINTMTLRWRASSSDNTSNAYYAVTRSTDSAGTSEYASTVPGTASAFLGKYNSDFNSVSFDIFDPQVASKTLFTGTAFSRGSSAGGLAAVNFGGGFDGTNAFDGMTLIASSGTITGTLKIYGYQN